MCVQAGWTGLYGYSLCVVPPWCAGDMARLYGTYGLSVQILRQGVGQKNEILYVSKN